MRVIVCGSRDWTDRDAVWHELDALLAQEAHPVKPGSLVIVHGDCPTGADHFAELWCNRNGFMPVRYPAEFALFGPSAGPRRNRAMAQAGGNLCLGFWNGGNRKGKEPGTLNMVREALRAGIPVRIVPPSKSR